MTSIKRRDMFGSHIVNNVETQSLNSNQFTSCVLGKTYKVKFKIKILSKFVGTCLKYVESKICF